MTGWGKTGKWLGIYLLLLIAALPLSWLIGGGHRSFLPTSLILLVGGATWLVLLVVLIWQIPKSEHPILEYRQRGKLARQLYKFSIVQAMSVSIVVLFASLALMYGFSGIWGSHQDRFLLKINSASAPVYGGRGGSTPPYFYIVDPLHPQDGWVRLSGGESDYDLISPMVGLGIPSEVFSCKVQSYEFLGGSELSDCMIPSSSTVRLSDAKSVSTALNRPNFKWPKAVIFWTTLLSFVLTLIQLRRYKARHPSSKD